MVGFVIDASDEFGDVRIGREEESPSVGAT